MYIFAGEKEFMKKESSTFNEINIKNNAPVAIRKKQNIWIFTLLAAFTAGILLGLIGLGLSGLVYFERAENAKTTGEIGTVLIIAAFPLIMLGAHALDKSKEIEAERK